MLRRAIRALGRGACHARPANALLRVAITFGGSDPVGATARVLRLLPAGRALDVVAIAGPGFTDREALHAAARAASSAGHAVELAEAPDEPGTVFATADAAICAAGGTLGELAFLGCPALAFAIVPDQVDGARAQAQDGLIAGGTTWTADDDDQLRDRLRGFLDDDRRRRQLAQRALATVDGQGAGRIITDILG
jgi:spore coat polysaccharide biosynthesis predicted glycosyltransferase SpsG